MLSGTILIAGFLIASIAWFGARTPGYSHLRHTISELGETGAVHAAAVGWLVFAPVGAALLILAAAAGLLPGATELQRALALLAGAVGVGYLGAAIFPCDPGSPLAGSGRQQLHNLAGGVEYLGGAAALALAARALPTGLDASLLRPLLNGGAFAVGCVAVLLSVPYAGGARGGIQRIGEIILFGGMILLAALV